MAAHTSSKKAHSKAMTKYIKQNLDRIEIRFPKEMEMKKAIANHAAITGESVTRFITRAIMETMDNDAWTEDIFPPDTEKELKKEFEERHKKEMESFKNYLNN